MLKLSALPASAELQLEFDSDILNRLVDKTRNLTTLHVGGETMQEKTKTPISDINDFARSQII